MRPAWASLGKDSAETKEHQRLARELSDEELRFLAGLPLTISVPTENVVVVHAGLVPGVPLRSQRPSTCMFLRNLVRDDSATDGEHLLPTEFIDVGVEWASLWQGPVHAVFGHDATRRLQQQPFATGLGA